MGFICNNTQLLINKMRESYNYWLNRMNYFGDGLAFGLIFGIIIGLSFGNMAAYVVLFTFFGGAIGSLIKRKKPEMIIRHSR